MARANRANYGALAETPEVVFGGVRPRNSSLGRSEFNQVKAILPISFQVLRFLIYKCFLFDEAK